MTTNGPELLGFVAATLTTLAFLPQVLRTLRTRSARDFSPLWIAFFGLGLACWLGYGALIGSLSLIGTPARAAPAGWSHCGPCRRDGRRSFDFRLDARSSCELVHGLGDFDSPGNRQRILPHG